MLLKPLFLVTAAARTVAVAHASWRLSEATTATALAVAKAIHIPAQAALKEASDDGGEALRRGAAAYTQLLKESFEDGEDRGCWQQVGEQLQLLQHQTHEDACSDRGEPLRELIALTRVKCIYTRSRRPFPGPDEGCYLFPHEVPGDWLSQFT